MPKSKHSKSHKTRAARRKRQIQEAKNRQKRELAEMYRKQTEEITKQMEAEMASQEEE